MQPDIFLSVPMHGHTATSGQAKATNGAEYTDFGRVFARLKGDEMQREAPNIESSSAAKRAEVSDNQAEDADVVSDEDVSVEDAEPLPDEASPLEEGGPLPGEAGRFADDAFASGEAMPQRQIAARPTAENSVQPSDLGTSRRSLAERMTADPPKPASDQDVEQIAAARRGQAQDRSHVAETNAPDRAAGTARETGDPHRAFSNALDPVGRYGAIPEPLSSGVPLTTVSMGLGGGQSEKELGIRTEGAVDRSRTGKGPTPFGEVIAPELEAIHALQIRPFTSPAEIRTSIDNGNATDAEVFLRTSDMTARVPEVYSGADGRLAGLSKVEGDLALGYETVMTDLPMIDEIAGFHRAGGANQPALLPAAMAATSNSLPLPEIGRQGLPGRSMATQPNLIEVETDRSLQNISATMMSVTPLIGGRDPRNEQAALGAGQAIGNLAATVRTEGQAAQATKHATAPAGFADRAIDPVNLSRANAVIEASGDSISRVPALAGQSSPSSPSSLSPQSAAPGPERKNTPSDLLSDQIKRGAGVQDALVQGKSAVLANPPRISEGQNDVASEPVEIRSGLTPQQTPETPTKAFVSTQGNSLGQSGGPGQFPQNTTIPGSGKPGLLSAASPADSDPAGWARTPAGSSEPAQPRGAAASQGIAESNLRPAHTLATNVVKEHASTLDAAVDVNRVIPSGEANSGLESSRNPQARAEISWIQTVSPPTSGQPGLSPLPQGSGEIAPQRDLAVKRYAGATEEPGAFSKVNTGGNAVEIRTSSRENHDPRANGLRQSDGGIGTTPVSVSPDRRPGPAIQPSAELRVRRSESIEPAQVKIQEGSSNPKGTGAVPFEVVANPLAWAFVVESPETQGDRPTLVPDTGRQEALERRQPPHVPSKGDASSVAVDDPVRNKSGLKEDDRSIRAVEVRFSEETIEGRQGAAEKTWPGLVQSSVIADVPPGAPNRAEVPGNSRTPDRTEAARSVTAVTNSSQPTRSGDMANPSTALGDMPKVQESLAKKTAGVPVDVAMPRFLPETTGHALRDIPTVEPPAPTSTAQYAALARDVAQQLSQVTRSVPGEVTELTLRPEELGQVRMRLSGSDGQIVLQILSERPETHDLMRRHIDIVERAFRDLGYHDIAFDFSFSGQRNSGSQKQAEAIRPEDTQAAELLPAQQVARRLTLVPGRLDIRL